MIWLQWCLTCLHSSVFLSAKNQSYLGMVNQFFPSAMSVSLRIQFEPIPSTSDHRPFTLRTAYFGLDPTGSKKTILLKNWTLQGLNLKWSFFVNFEKWDNLDQLGKYIHENSFAFVFVHFHSRIFAFWRLHFRVD